MKEYILKNKVYIVYPIAILIVIFTTFYILWENPNTEDYISQQLSSNSLSMSALSSSSRAASLQASASSSREAEILSALPDLKVEDIVVGTGNEIVKGDNITVNYTGKLENGEVFDSSLDEGRTPLQIQNIGEATVIAGWNYGLMGMKVGGKRILTIPPVLGYGNASNGKIPAKSTLVFEIELISIDK